MTLPFERRLCRRNPVPGGGSEGAVEAPSDDRLGGEAPLREEMTL